MAIILGGGQLILLILFCLAFFAGILWYYISWTKLFYLGVEIDDELRIDIWGRGYDVLNYIIKNPFKKNKEFNTAVMHARYALAFLFLLFLIAYVVNLAFG
jgi:hypothetical protein